MIIELGSLSSTIEDIAAILTPECFNRYKDACHIPVVVAMALLIKSDGETMALEKSIADTPTSHPRWMFTTKCDKDKFLTELYFEVYNGDSCHRSPNLKPWKTSRQIQLCLETLVEAEWLPPFFHRVY